MFWCNMLLVVRQRYARLKYQVNFSCIVVQMYIPTVYLNVPAAKLEERSESL